MKANTLLDKALDFIVETQESNDYICEQMIDEHFGDYCANNCQNLNKEAKEHGSFTHWCYVKDLLKL